MARSPVPPKMTMTTDDSFFPFFIESMITNFTSWCMADELIPYNKAPNQVLGTLLMPLYPSRMDLTRQRILIPTEIVLMDYRVYRRYTQSIFFKPLCGLLEAGMVDTVDSHGLRGLDENQAVINVKGLLGANL